MTFDKGHREFYAVDMGEGWHTPPGYPPGFKQKILSGALDETAKRGNRTRLFRLDPGTFSTTPVVHDYWEEVFVVSGDMIVGNDARCSAPTPMRCARPASFTVPSSRRPAACCSRPTGTREVSRSAAPAASQRRRGCNPPSRSTESADCDLEQEP